MKFKVFLNKNLEILYLVLDFLVEKSSSWFIEKEEEEEERRRRRKLLLCNCMY